MAQDNPFDFSHLLNSFGAPGIITPTLDVDELDKKIKDLKAVEGWLSMNLSMLQMSIQGLEVQRNTLASLKAMGEAFRQSAAAPPATDSAAPEPAASPKAASDPSSTAPAAPTWPWEVAAQAMNSFQQQLQAVAETTPAKETPTPQQPATEQAAKAAKTRKPRKPAAPKAK